MARTADPGACCAGLLRVGAAVAVLPGFGEQNLPARIRLAVALAFTAIVAPAVLPMVPAEHMSRPLRWPKPADRADARARVAASSSARADRPGTIIGQSTSIAQLFGGAMGEAQPVIGNILTMAALALALSAGLHIHAAELLILSYDLLPSGGVPAHRPIWRNWGLAQTRRRPLPLAFTLAAPFVIGAFLYNVALGIINRAMPQLAVSFIGAPALTLGGLVLLAVLTACHPRLLVAGADGLWLADPLSGRP
ncbi:MAG: flagellar biosynthetic protein FliR [Gemmobacter sp.]|nr:flagellar biosynthetic protein FliR [Gemmobacter sp.]